VDGGSRSQGGKAIARKAFDAALKRELHELMFWLVGFSSI
jgi:hypothetical protein